MTYNLGKTATGRAVSIAPRFAARHGLIAGATGTGKSYTIARLVEQMTGAGIPVFLFDVKGDLSGLARSTPCRFFDPAGITGARFSIRADDLGADSMARALQLSDAQAGALEILYSWAADNRAPMGSLADMGQALAHLDRQRKAVAGRYGHMTAASLAVLKRALLRIERAPCALFGRDSFDVAGMMSQPGATILDARQLYQAPTLYGAAVIYLLDSLYASLPEVGDSGAPRLALFLDESHLIFSELPPMLLQRVERIVRLIRSKGVAIYFASQSPADIPAPILAQLGNRIQHGLRGATLQDLRAIRAAAETMPVNPAIDAGAAITRLGVGQALVSTIGADGVPSPVEIVQIAPPRASLAPIDDDTRALMTPRLDARSVAAPGDKATRQARQVMALAIVLVMYVLPGAALLWMIMR